MKKQPEKFNFSMLRDAVEKSSMQTEGMLFNHDFALVRGDSGRLFRFMMGKRTPLLIDDYRLGMVEEGDIRVVINLIERRVGPGTLVFVGPGSIVEPVSVSERVSLKGVALFGDLPLGAGRQPSIISRAVRGFLLPIDSEQQQLVSQMVDMLWQIATSPAFCRDSFDCAVMSLLHTYSHIYNRWAQQKQSSARDAGVFDRFIQLVNRHAATQHHIDFYASELCLSPRYMSTLVRQASGKAAKEWIDDAMVARIKIELRHSDKPVARIAEEFGFASASFFCKYFKRMTGLRPQEYRHPL